MNRHAAIMFLTLAYGLMSIMASAASAADPVKDAVVSVGGILTTDGNKDSCMILTDGEDAPVKYTFADSFDKKSLQNLFSVTRILIMYSQDANGRKLLSLKRAVVPAAATVTGAVVYATDFFVAVKPRNGVPDGYALRQFPPGEMGNKLKSLKKGDTVTVKYRTDGERHRIDTMDIVARAPAGNLPEGVKAQKDIEFAKVGDLSLRLDIYSLFLKTLTPGATKPVEGLLGGLGDKVKDLAVQASPVHYASKEAAPFLIFHGDKDNTVPLGQSQSLNDALKAAGADVTLEVLKGVEHGTMSPATIAAGTAFMDKHLK